MSNAGKHFIVWPLNSYRREFWLCLLANVPPVRKPFPFGADCWLTWASRNVECCRENSLHFSSPTGMSGAVPQETSSSNSAGSQGNREHASDGQHTLKCSSAGLAVFVCHYLTVTKTKSFLIMADFIYNTLSFSRLLCVSQHATPPGYSATPTIFILLFLYLVFPSFCLMPFTNKDKTVI